MGLLDKAKAAAKLAAENSSALASNTVGGLWATHGGKACDAIYSHAKQVAKQGASVISDDECFRLKVIDPAWEMLPTPVRLLGRERLKWDELFLSTRSRIFVIDGEDVTVHPDAKKRIGQLLSRVSRLGKPKKIPGIPSVNYNNENAG